MNDDDLTFLKEAQAGMEEIASIDIDGLLDEAEEGFREMSQAALPYDELMQGQQQLIEQLNELSQQINALLDLYNDLAGPKMGALNQQVSYLSGPKILERDAVTGRCVSVNGRPVIYDELGRVVGLN